LTRTPKSFRLVNVVDGIVTVTGPLVVPAATVALICLSESTVNVDAALLQRIHNPGNYVCGCDADCWCRRTAIGRLVKWWFPARLFGIRHKSSFFDRMTVDEIREWKREQEGKGLYPMVVQPEYEKIVRLGPSRWGVTVRKSDGRVTVHEILGRPRFDTST
jgi:hypothetical protein